MELTIALPECQETRLGVLGPQNCNLKMMREALGVHIADRNRQLILSGSKEEVGRAIHTLEKLSEAACKKQPLSRQGVIETIAGSRPGAATSPLAQLNADRLEVYLPGKTIRPATTGQKAYLQQIIDNDLTFCTGPAGCGKTFLAVAYAAAMLKRGMVRKLVLVRPAVEAGERIGFLPGTLQEKVNPYLRPLLDALSDMMPFEQVQQLMDTGIIEIVPLAFMRGRTLNDACIILDEAQNTTKNQMLMFLTRLGHGGKMVVTGDTSQIDLPDPTESGLIDAIRRLGHMNQIGLGTLTKADIVRHGLVQRILDAYQPPERS